MQITRAAPPPGSTTATSNPPPPRTLKEIFLPSGDQFGSVQDGQVESIAFAYRDCGGLLRNHGYWNRKNQAKKSRASLIGIEFEINFYVVMIAVSEAGRQRINLRHAFGNGLDRIVELFVARWPHDFKI